MSLPKAHRVPIDSTNLLERLNAEIKRRTDVVASRMKRHNGPEGAANADKLQRRTKSRYPLRVK
jgi:transposase-like protein